MVKKEKVKFCRCCKKKIVCPMGNQKYCSACSVSRRDMVHLVHSLKRDVRRLRRIVYGQDNGAERVRLK